MRKDNHLSFGQISGHFADHFIDSRSHLNNGNELIFLSRNVSKFLLKMFNQKQFYARENDKK